MDRKRFPPDVEEYLHRVCLNAVLRAIENGTYKQPQDNQDNTEVELLKAGNS
ncbi:hypothetical protein WJ0W_003531 [Paenibacillus melissococcoides]|uniref:Uncharacterized protein n=1 Tax=Paenibacillus melissococcoides TaxID=2912268 RepID=A0ABN8U972_9BACL|nr:MULTISPECIES: hypothetical protein [Paenibacillus]GIO82265.1 hypothetical protein J6TS7_58750 [Paenibacillus dendritiformis]CAH8246296.1 hypothetical protein WJ0W_003531 [Paenibacillus melissococcoides]CAH8713542.1 hypothetical protein WDD9_003603 [Paenibacillus melissococcoides]CAH8714277.1 hypothetical protein HTL2_003906 [Paenibacillus melissococcoides]